MKTIGRNPPGRGASRGFTLVELLIVIGIIVILFGLIGTVVSAANRQQAITTTETNISSLAQELDLRQGAETGRYPVRPGGAGDFDGGDPGYYEMSCAPMGSASTGTEDNRALASYLQDHSYHVNQENLQGGKLIDGWGRPLVIRFLLLPATPESKGAPVEKMYIWSYGPDKINNTDASPTYTHQGPPDYDKAEAARIEASWAAGGDDIHNHQ
ncbi:MAG: prepilin-type N-terminal cleavage/methylation domain-containing protein [Planctomycetes bacterium]|nr:prepilin-type N-terminal cleavage/methylation domain-containing protein [Planctomycetota bacterium]